MKPATQKNVLLCNLPESAKVGDLLGRYQCSHADGTETTRWDKYDNEPLSIGWGPSWNNQSFRGPCAAYRISAIVHPVQPSPYDGHNDETIDDFYNDPRNYESRKFYGYATLICIKTMGLT